MLPARKRLYRTHNTRRHAPVSIQRSIETPSRDLLRPDTACLANLLAVIRRCDLDCPAHLIQTRADAHAQSFGQRIFLLGGSGAER